MEAPVDREVLAGLRGLQGEEETDIVAELAGVFIGDARSGLQEVEEALQKDDAPVVERVAHKESRLGSPPSAVQAAWPVPRGSPRPP